MTNRHHYLQEMAASGYSADTIDDFHRLCLPYIAETFFPKKDTIIMDIGGGWGHCLLPLKAVGYNNLLMVDCDTYSRNALEQKAIQVLNLDVEKESLPIQDLTIDVVISFHLIEHLKDSKNFLEEVFRVLKNGGNFIMVTPDWRKQYKTFWRDHTHIHPYDKKSVARLLRCFAFDIVWLRSFGCMRGIGRSGLWKIWPSLMFTGTDLIAVAEKP